MRLKLSHRARAHFPSTVENNFQKQPLQRAQREDVGKQELALQRVTSKAVSRGPGKPNPQLLVTSGHSLCCKSHADSERSKRPGVFQGWFRDGDEHSLRDPAWQGEG